MASTYPDSVFEFPRSHWAEWEDLFPDSLVKLLVKLHDELEEERQLLLKERVRRQYRYDQGELPQFLERTSEAFLGDWKVAQIPAELMCRRVEITGPVNSTKMVIQMLSRNDRGARADMAMLDFEDSMKPTFDHVLAGFRNVIGAVSGNLRFETEAEESGGSGKVYQLDPNDMAYVMVRCRGLHLSEVNVKIKGESISAGLFDLVVCFFHTADLYLRQNKTPKFYVPKCEHYLEARWWSRLFTLLEENLGYPVGTLRATFLIETLPATFQVEEILYELRHHAVGLNVGRWDKIFSDIKVLRNHKDRILADRSSITMERPWMENYAKRVIKICHERGAFAMGGMSAFTPGKTATERQEQYRKVLEDKRREASWGHDGCWVSHPFFIGVAMEAFTTPNQLNVLQKDFDKYASVLPQGTSPHTLQGLRTNIRVGIVYLHGWRDGLGCVAFDNLMEDLATLEISRAQTWQWLHHGILLDEGMRVTPDLIKETFEDEFQKILSAWGISLSDKQSWVKVHEAKEQAQALFLSDTLSDFLTTESELVEKSNLFISKDVPHGKLPDART